MGKNSARAQRGNILSAGWAFFVLLLLLLWQSCRKLFSEENKGEAAPQSFLQAENRLLWWLQGRNLLQVSHEDQVAG